MDYFNQEIKEVRVLLVDDNAVDRLAVIRNLQKDQKFKYEFIEIGKASQALEKINEGSSIDAVILDYKLPDMDAFEFLSHLKNIHRINRPPILILTGFGNEKLAVDFMKQGVYDYLNKNDIHGNSLHKSMHFILQRFWSERQQQYNQQYLSTMINTIPNPVYSRDLDGIYWGCNEAYSEFLNRPKEEIIGHSLAEFFPAEIVEKIKKQDKELIAKGGIQTLETRFANHLGDERILLLRRALFLDLHGKPNGIVAIIMDITDHRKMEEELLISNETKDRFFSLIAHDLRGPIGSISGVLELLVDDQFDFEVEERKRLLRQLGLSAKTTLELLENLLQWSNSQRGTIRFQPIELSLRQIISENINLLENSALSKRLRYDVRLDGDIRFFSDQNMVRTIFRNLISNAIKFSFEDGVIEIGGWKSDTEVICYVKDWGPGILPEIRPKLFKVGEKVTSTGTKKEKGTGLGLLLCKEFVERHDGHISFKDNPEGGTIFQFSLPLRIE